MSHYSLNFYFKKVIVFQIWLFSSSHKFWLKRMPYSRSALGNTGVTLATMRRRRMVTVQTILLLPQTRNILLILFHSNPKCRSENECSVWICLTVWHLNQPRGKKNWASEMVILFEWVSFWNVHRAHFPRLGFYALGIYLWLDRGQTSSHSPKKPDVLS